MMDVKFKTKIRLATGEIIPATLYGVKGGDLFGGKTKYKGKTHIIGDEKRNLPDTAFPFEATERTPFIDVPYRRRIKRRKTK